MEKKKIHVTASWEFSVPAGWVSSDGRPEDEDFTSHVAQGMVDNPLALLATRMTDPDNKNNWRPKAVSANLVIKHAADGSCGCIPTTEENKA